jgi:predicted Zn-dependent protease
MKRLALCALLTMALPAGAQFGGIDIGKIIDYGKKATEATRDFTQDEEIAIGEAATAGFLGASPLDTHADLQRYVNRVGKWLALHSERPDLPWSFAVIDTETINAFALPGGYIIVSKGLLRRLGNESELAGVLAHEIAHVVKRHQITAIQSAAKSGLLTSIGKDFASSAIARTGGGVVGQQLKQFGASVAADLLKDGFFLRPLDRSLETEADQMAVVIAARSGYDPYGLVAVLQMLAQTKGESDGASIFSTHPAPAERMADLERVMPALDRYAAQPQVEARFKKAVAQ